LSDLEQTTMNKVKVFAKWFKGRNQFFEMQPISTSPAPFFYF